MYKKCYIVLTKTYNCTIYPCFFRQSRIHNLQYTNLFHNFASEKISLGRIIYIKWKTIIGMG